MLITWNRLRMMREGLESLLEKTKGVDYEVIAWDNGSTDGTAEYLGRDGRDASPGAGHPPS